MHDWFCLFRLTLLSVIAITIIGCAGGSSSTARGQELRIRYAEVLDIERVPMPSAAPAGAIVGGFTGLVLSSRGNTLERIAATAGGAALGGLATKALEGDNRGYAYRLRFSDRSESRFITEKDFLRKGDCVSVESSRNGNNIRRVPESLCEPRPIARADSVHQEQAEQCLRAKEQLLDALTQEEVDNAARKVEVICQF